MTMIMIMMMMMMMMMYSKVAQPGRPDTTTSLWRHNSQTRSD